MIKLNAITIVLVSSGLRLALFFRNKKVPVCVSNTSIETPFTRYNRFDNRSYRVNGVMPYADFHKIYLQREKGAGTGMYTVTKRH